MSTLKSSAAAFVGNLTAVKSTTVTAAVVLACTVLPILGGAPKAYELRQFAAWATGGAISSSEQVVHPNWGGVQTIAAVDRGMQLTSAAFVSEASAAEVETPVEESAATEATPLEQVVAEPTDVCTDDCAFDPVSDDHALAELPAIEDDTEVDSLDAG